MGAWLSVQWFAAKPTLFGLIFAPLSGVYGLLSWLHKFSYQVGMKRSYVASVPVFTVGNLIAGGAGKTPVILTLVRFFQAHNIKVAVIARGYGVTIEGDDPLIVSPEVLSNSDANLPDEASLIAVATGVIVFCHPQRRIAAAYAANQGAELILADDGLQHYALHSSKRILVHPPNRHRYGNGWLLPVGPLRQRPSHSGKIDYELQDHRYVSGADCDKNIIPYHYTALQWVSVFDESQVKAVDAFTDESVSAFAGIAYPERFREQLRQQGVTVSKFASYPDHHRLSKSELQHWLSIKEIVVMTAKDAMKFRVDIQRYFPAQPIEIDRFWFLEMSAELPVDFLAQLKADFLAIKTQRQL